MSEANASRGFLPATWNRLLGGLILLAFFSGAAGLWWRFGEAVFLNSVMNAIIACF
jgi:hypothetical protein